MTREIRYVLMDPTGNRTILVESPVPAAQQPAVAAELMAREPTAEQAGFVSSSAGCDIALRMAGGEFCGNAAMSAAALCSLRSGRRPKQFLVKVSGEEAPVSVRLEKQEEALWQGIVRMPRPQSVGKIPFADGQVYPVVSFCGITHVILENGIPEAEAEVLARRWCSELGAEALGLMFLERDQGKLKPLVYVPAADTLFWESACGSGTSAVGAWLAHQSGQPVSLALQQPGGVLEISAAPEGALFLKGTVHCLYERTAVVSWPEEAPASL